MSDWRAGAATHCFGGNELSRNSGSYIVSVSGALRVKSSLVSGGICTCSPLVEACPARDGAPRLEEMSLEEVERFLVQKALERFAGNVSQAAEFLGLSRSGLYRRLQKLGL